MYFWFRNVNIQRIPWFAEKCQKNFFLATGLCDEFKSWVQAIHFSSANYYHLATYEAPVSTV